MQEGLIFISGKQMLRLCTNGFYKMNWQVLQGDSLEVLEPTLELDQVGLLK